MATVKEKMTAIADAIREKTGGTEPLTLDNIATDIQSVYDIGKQTRYDEFWDDYQSNGERRIYTRAFQGSCWTDKTFNPKYDIIATSAQATFHTNVNITRIPVLVDVSESTVVSQLFYGCSNLAELNLKTSENTPWITGGFQACVELSTLNIEGVIGTNGFDVHWSAKLTHESLMSIINALKDYSGSGMAYTVTLGTTNLAKLTDEEKAIATQKGWTLA